MAGYREMWTLFLFFILDAGNLAPVISSLTVTPSNGTVLLLATNSCVTLNFTMSSGSGNNIEVLVDNQTYKTVPSTETNVTLTPAAFTGYGDHEVVIKSPNSFFWYPLIYEEMVGEISIRPLTSVFMFNTTANFTVSANKGTNLEMQMFVISQEVFKFMACSKNEQTFNVPYDFDGCKEYKLVFSLSNGIYKKSIQKNVSIVPNAEDFDVTFSKLYIVAPDMLQIYIMYSKCLMNQTNVTATLSIGNEDVDQITLLKPNNTFSREYLMLGKHKVNVTINTNKNSAVFSKDVTVATNATLEPKQKKYFVGDDIYFTIEKTTVPGDTFKINISDTLSDVYLVNCTCPFGALFKKYAEIGTKNISWTLSCQYFTKSGSVEISVYGKLLNVTVDEESITIPDGLRKFKINVKSSAKVPGECTVDYGDGTTEDFLDLEFPTDFTAQKNYTLANNYTFDINCTGALNSVQTTVITQVTDFDLNDLSLNYSTIVPLGTVSDFLLSYRGNQTPPLKFVTEKWDFGDGDSAKEKPLLKYTETHLYKSFGNYSGSLDLAVLDRKRKIPFDVQAGIFRFTIENTTVFAKGTGVKGSFELVSPDYTTDLGITYNITFSNKNHNQVCTKSVNLASQQASFACPIEKTGIYSVSVKVVGNSYKEKFKFNETILVVNNVTDLKLGAPERLASYKTLELNISAGVETKDLTNLTCVFTLSDGNNETKKGDISATSVIKVTFKNLKPGLITIQTNCSNELSSEKLSKNVTIFSDCFEGDTLFTDKEMRLQNTKNYTISTDVKVKEACQTFPLSYLWEFKNKTIRDKSFIIYKNDPPGNFRIDLTITVANGTISDHIYVDLTLPDLEAIIKGGSVVMIPKEDMNVDAASLSYDPSQGQGKTTGLSFSWSCRIHSDSSDSFDPNFNASEIDFSGSPDGVGCPPLENVGDLQIPSSKLDVKKWYVFQVEISKGNRTATTRQAIFITPLKIIPLQIGCVINCLQKIATNLEAIFKVEFSAESSSKLRELGGKPSYRWKLFLSPSKNVTPIQGNIDEPEVKLFGGSLEQEVTYLLQVVMGNLTGYAESYALLDLKTNRSPDNGNCTVDPLNGTLASMFNIKCADWQDPDGIGKYIVVFKVKEKQHIVSETQQTLSNEFKLPIGDEDDDYNGNLLIQIYDNFEAYTQMTYTVQVKPSASAANNLLNSESLEDQMKNNPAAIMKNAGNLISTLNTAKVPVSEDSVSNIDQMPETELNEMFSQDASEVNKKWDSIVGGLTNDKNEKQMKIEKKMNEMTDFMTKQVMSTPPTNEVGIQEKAEVFRSLFANPKLSLLDSAETAISATDKLGNVLSDLSRNKPINTGLLKTIHSVTDLAGTMFDQLVPEEPLSSEPMTLDKMRKKMELEYPDPDSPISIEERAFLALKKYQHDKIKKEKQRSMSVGAVPKMMNTMGQIANAMSTLAVTDGPPVEQNTKNVNIGQWKVSENSSSKTFQLKSGQSVQLGDIQGTEISMYVLKKNPYTFDAGCENLKSVISLKQKTDSDKSEKSSSGTVTIDFKHEPVKMKVFQPMVNSSEMIFHSFIARTKDDVTCIKAKPAGSNIGYKVYMRSEELPTEREFDYRTAVVPANLTADGVYTICFPGNTISKAGKIYVGLIAFESMGLKRSKRSTSNENKTMDTSYSFGSLVAGCSVLDEKNKKWSSSDCKPSYNNDKSAIECHCDNPVSTTFSNSFFVPPNSIDFSTVFGKFDLGSNGAVFGVVIAFICLYFILLVAVSHFDRKDYIRWSVVPLFDSLDSDPFWYLISVYTGLQYGSGTKSRISFKVAGEDIDTKVHSLTEGHQKKFNSGSILKFFMSTNESLGDMQYLHIWHDNSGVGDNASWYLNKIEITDLQTSESYIFLCNSWLAVERGDGLISRVLPVSSGNELQSFNNKFFEHTRQKITDEHIWLSIVFRPVESPFNRKKRLSTAFALLFLTMIANAMFYSKPAQVIKIGPIRFSITMIWTSFMSIIISTLPIILIMTLFKKSKRKPIKTAKTSPSLELLEDSTDESESTSRRISESSLKESDELTLPWFCAYIAWIIVVLAILVPSFFVILYSQEWGKEKSEEWLTAFFFSFFESCFLVDPLKVIVVSIILSYFSKKLIKPDAAEKKIDKISNDTDKEALPPSFNPPLSERTIKQARAKRRSDLRMREVIQDICLYVVFLWVIYTLSNDNRDPNAFEQSQQIDKLFQVSNKFKGIRTDQQLIKWINSTFFPNFFPQRNYKGTTLKPLRKLFTSDQANYRMGPARFRLLRMKRESCKIPYFGTVECMDSYNILTEDTDGYCLNWKPPPCPENQEATHLTFNAWNFTSATKIWGVPYLGIYGLYGGGGYILNLEINLPISIKMLDEINKNLWFDRETRAVFIEFTLYNANVNLFTYVILLAEIPNIGVMLPYTFFYSFKALPDEGNGKVFVCQVLFVLFITVMLIRSLYRMFQMRGAFLNEIWYVLDFLSALSCVAVVGMYVMRVMMVHQANESLKEDPKKFVNFYHIVVWDQIFVFLMATLVFLSTIRFLRILGYNKRISAVGMVITSAKKDMSGFFILFIILSWIFSYFGYLLFGRKLVQYKSLWDSMKTMFVGILGKTYYSKLKHSRTSFGPLFYLVFVFVFIFFLLRMIESILNESIAKINSQMFRHEESLSLYLYNSMPSYIKKILFPGREHEFERQSPEFSDVQNLPETKNNLPEKKVADEPIDIKNLNLSSFDMMYQLINRNLDDCIKETYAENYRKKVKF